MIKNILVSVIGLSLLSTMSFAAQWTLDAVHSNIGFEVKHLVISTTKGNFKEFSGELKFDEADLEKSQVTITVKTASIDTDNADRDKHLKSPDFLNTEAHPEMKFTSKKIVKKDGNYFSLIGDLTILETTKEVTFDCELNGVVTDPWGNTKSGFAASTTINRQDFGVKWSKNLDSGGLVVGNDVKILLDFEFTQAK